MTPLINLLPWRALQRQRRLYFRIGTTIFVTLLLGCSFWTTWAWFSQEVIALQGQGDVLKEQLRKLQETLPHQQGWQLGDDQRSPGGIVDRERQHHVSRWGDILAALASQLPESSWLSTVTWQESIMTLEGYTVDMADLERINLSLKQLPGHFHVRAGPVSHHASFGLSYSFTLADHGGALGLP
ncbi:PilN domain-containing protein [Citrobacter sp. JGM124]|uniref:PilN domain-containing protein n=1 Tax=Citrobacter sp. JGM124 TaxID=2799789 RepID=UPI001BA771F9|nr:PilN domain-containing protein [Citrobacter sp. JGM124]MBS0848269.1 PilN domain-containing protein [Citrobacter sp. JGM124]